MAGIPAPIVFNIVIHVEDSANRNLTFAGPIGDLSARDNNGHAFVDSSSTSIRWVTIIDPPYRTSSSPRQESLTSSTSVIQPQTTSSTLSTTISVTSRLTVTVTRRAMDTEDTKATMLGAKDRSTSNYESERITIIPVASPNPTQSVSGTSSSVNRLAGALTVRRKLSWVALGMLLTQCLALTV